MSDWDWSKCFPFKNLTEKYFVVVQRPLELAGLGEGLAINASRTLTSLGLRTRSIIVHDDHLDPLCGLSHELGFIAGNNILEELELYVWFEDASSSYPSNPTHFELWSAFDSSEPERDAILKSLKENKFARLVESEAVEFNFSVSEI